MTPNKILWTIGNQGLSKLPQLLQIKSDEGQSKYLVFSDAAWNYEWAKWHYDVVFFLVYYLTRNCCFRFLISERPYQKSKLGVWEIKLLQFREKN